LILLDTNVLVYALNADSPQHADCRRVVDLSTAGALPAVLLPQILVECYAVVTSPRRIPRALTPQQAWAALRMLARALDVRPPAATLLDDLDLLMTQHPRRGRDIFDLAIVAQMLDHGIRAICTCNVSDFGVAGIRALEPAQALAVYA
jgi:uncharacterized protein